jgi:hypothetical protein
MRLLQEPCLTGGQLMAEFTVHFLLEGRALCGRPGVPGDWGPDHKWVRTDSDEGGPRSAANCPRCLAVRSAQNRDAWRDGEGPERERDWFFTFGPAHHYPGKPEQPLVRSFVRFRGTYMSARMQMIDVFDGKWAFQYESAQAAGVDEHGLTEVHPLVGPVAEPAIEGFADAVASAYTPPRYARALDLVPDDLREAYCTDATVHAHFACALNEGHSLDHTLIQLVLALLAEKATLTAAVLDYAKSAPPPVLHFEGPPPVWLHNPKGEALTAELRAEKLHAPPGGGHAVPTGRGVSWLPARSIDDLLGAVLAWRAQGRKSKWTTAASRHLADVADRLRERYPDLCEAFTAEPVEERPPCPECQRPMARYAGPGDARGWTCVHCEADDET